METKKTETLDSVLVAKNFYRVRDAYAIKLYGQDEGMSFDELAKDFLDQTLLLRMACYMAQVLGI